MTGDSRGAFDKLATRLLLPIAKELGWSAKPNESEESKLMRQAVLEALAVHTSDPWLYSEASRRASAYLRDPGSVDPDTATVALRAAARKGTVTLAALRKALSDAVTPEQRLQLLRALGSFSDAKELHGALDLTLDGTVKSGDVIYLVRSASPWAESRAALLDWLELHLADLAVKIDGMSASNMLGSPLARTCDAAARARVEQAFSPLVTRIGGSQRRLSETMEAADACIDLRARQAQAASAELARLSGDARVLPTATKRVPRKPQ